MAIAFVKNLGSANSKASATTIVIASLPTAGIVAGNTVMVAVTGSTAGTALSSVTDSKGNTYTILANVAGTTSRLAIAASTIGTTLLTTDTITATFAASVGIRVIGAVEFSGLVTPAAVDVTKADAGTSNAPSTGASAATTQADELVFAAFSTSNGTTTVVFTPGSGYTADQAATTGASGTNRTLNTEHKIVSAIGAQTADAGYNASLPWDAVLATVKMAGAAGTFAVTDSVALADTSALTATYPLADAGTVSEEVSESAAQTRVESVTLTETATPAVTITVVDQATVADVSALSALPAVADAAALSEAASFEHPDTFLLLERAEVEVLAGDETAVSATDTATLAEAVLLETSEEPPEPPPPSVEVGIGGGGDAWGATAGRPYLRYPEPQRAREPAPARRRRRLRTEDLVRLPAPAQPTAFHPRLPLLPAFGPQPIGSPVERVASRRRARMHSEAELEELLMLELI
jgi:hypothetical protein